MHISIQHLIDYIMQENIDPSWTISMCLFEDKGKLVISFKKI